MVNCNCKIVTRLKIPENPLNIDPKYGPSKWTPNMDPPIIWDDEIMGKSWGNHRISMGMPLGRRGKLEINCRPKSGYYACKLSARLPGKAARQGQGKGAIRCNMLKAW
jgi:hypothetical protein